MRTEIKHPEYLAFHVGNATWRAPAAAPGKGWAIVLLAVVFMAGVWLGGML